MTDSASRSLGIDPLQAGVLHAMASRVAEGARLDELARRMVNIQEEERLRLAGELHDQVGANLAAIHLNLRSLGRLMPGADPQLESLLAETGALLAETISSIRSACAELRPATLDYSGLVAALEELAQRAGRRRDWVVRFRQEGMHERLLPTTESMLFRIVQEALTNCAKHSNAGKVGIVVRRQDRAVVLSVTDDGTGFDTGLPGSTGLGLLAMRERAALAGGKLSIISSPGNGTQIRVEIPAAHAFQGTCADSIAGHHA